MKTLPLTFTLKVSILNALIDATSDVAGAWPDFVQSFGHAFDPIHDHDAAFTAWSAMVVARLERAGDNTRVASIRAARLAGRLFRVAVTTTTNRLRHPRGEAQLLHLDVHPPGIHPPGIRRLVFLRNRPSSLAMAGVVAAEMAVEKDGRRRGLVQQGQAPPSHVLLPEGAEIVITRGSVEATWVLVPHYDPGEV